MNIMKIKILSIKKTLKKKGIQKIQKKTKRNHFQCKYIIN